MKKCRRLPEPPTLEAYRQAQPQGSWDQMRNDPFHGGQQASTDGKRTLVQGTTLSVCILRSRDR